VAADTVLSDLISRLLDQWAYLNKVTLDFIRPGKPTENAFIEFLRAGAVTNKTPADEDPRQMLWF
jgi:hypothetical protein